MRSDTEEGAAKACKARASVTKKEHAGKLCVILRKPAGRLGKVVFANEVSIGGVGGVVAQVHRNLDIGWWLGWPIGIF